MLFSFRIFHSICVFKRSRQLHPMPLNPRQMALIQTVQERGHMSIESLAQHFGVTLQTVRRDVQKLADSGDLTRFHGGVRAGDSTTRNTAYRVRREAHSQAKRRMAQQVARSIANGCSLFMSIGTSVEAVARELLHHQDLRVITNNLHVAQILSVNPRCEVIVAAGVVRLEDQAVIGEHALQFIRQFRVDIGLIGISGIEADGSLRDFDLREVMVSRAIIEQSRQVYLVADASKFGRRAMAEVAPLKCVHTVFTDAAPGPHFEQLMQAHGVQCRVADAEEFTQTPTPSNTAQP